MAREQCRSRRRLHLCCGECWMGTAVLCMRWRRSAIGYSPARVILQCVCGGTWVLRRGAMSCVRLSPASRAPIRCCLAVQVWVARDVRRGVGDVSQVCV